MLVLIGENGGVSASVLIGTIIGGVRVMVQVLAIGVFGISILVARGRSVESSVSTVSGDTGVLS